MPKKATKSPSWLDPVLAAAATHPTRVHCLTVLNERSATAGEIGEEIGRTSRHVNYHLNKLEGLGLVELVAREQVHGGRVVSHRYRATQRPLFDQESRGAMTDVEQAGVTMTILGVMSEDLSRATAAGTINWPPPSEPDLTANHISRIPLAVDHPGWNEIADVLKDTLDQILEIQERSANRSAGTSEQLILTKVELLHFKSPDPV